MVIEGGGTDYSAIVFSYTALARTLWHVRNKMAIEKTFPKHPIDVTYNFISYMQRWRVLTKGNAQLKIDKVIDRGRPWLRDFRNQE